MNISEVLSKDRALTLSKNELRKKLLISYPEEETEFLLRMFGRYGQTLFDYGKAYGEFNVARKGAE